MRARILLMLLASCAISGSAEAAPAGAPPGKVSCTRSIQKHFGDMKALFDGTRRPTGRARLIADEVWPSLTGAIVTPVVDRAWRDIDRRSVVLTIRASGALALEQVAFGDAPTNPIARAELGTTLATSLRAGHKSGRKRLTIVAHKDARAALVLEVVRQTPAGTSVALAVSKPAATIMNRHRRAAPRMPASLERLLEEGLVRHGDRLTAFVTSEGAAELRPLIGSCTGIAGAWRELREAGGGEVLVPGIMAALEGCQCGTANVPALGSLVTFLFGMHDDNGWIPLDRAAVRRATALGPDASVAELAAILTGP